MITLAQRIAEGPILIDGGLSTQLETQGADVHDPLWTARILLDDPELVTRAHRAFVDAGAEVVITASYQVSRAGFEATGRPAALADRALRASVAAARAASPAFVAASVGPYGAISHDGAEYRGRYGRSIDELASFHAERIAVLADAEPDLLAIETVPDADEAVALMQALDAAPGIPAWLSFTAADDATLWAGQPIEDAARITHPTVIAIGINCTAPEHVPGLLRRMSTVTALPLLAYPNAGGTWHADDGTWHGPDPRALAHDVPDWVDAGARIIGGCCGTDAMTIAAMGQALSTR